MSPTSEFTICATESANFARLSGDYNPLHLDPVAARRTQFGDTVVHGIHLLLATLDRTVGSWSPDGSALAGLSFVFSNPVRTSARIAIRMTADTDGRRIRFVGESEHHVAFTAISELDSAAADPGPEPQDLETAPSAPELQIFPPASCGGTVPLRLARANLAALFPALAKLSRRSWIADLLATTRVVGMQCPGLHSVYSTGRLRRIAGGSPASMSYRIDRTDDRFQMIRMAVAGAELGGQIEAFFRPAPVAQLSCMQIAQRVAPGSFRGQRALVIGGSRGLGELTAKIIACGGGDVMITYSRGREDAQEICAQARQAGHACSAERLDLGAAEESPAWLAQPFTHVYFFASPPIQRNATGRWDQALFERLSNIYVHSFAAIAHKLLAAGSPPVRHVRFLYPSSVFLDEYAKGFAEYCVAKAAGEALCAQLEQQYGAVFARPRLPRMRTDQTSGVRDAAMPDSFAVIEEMLRQFCASPGA